MKHYTRIPAYFRCWIALSSVGIQSEDAQKKVEVTSNDPAQPEELRLIAEAILVNQKQIASTSFIHKMDVFLTQFGARDGVVLVTGSPQSSAEGKITARERSLFAVLEVLNFMHGQEVEELVFRHLASLNIWQNRILGLIAARRWPQHLLNVSSGADQERRRLLAVVCVLHPELGKNVRLFIPDKELNAEHMKSIDRVGINGFVTSAFESNLIIL